MVAMCFTLAFFVLLCGLVLDGFRDTVKDDLQKRERRGGAPLGGARAWGMQGPSPGCHEQDKQDKQQRGYSGVMPPLTWNLDFPPSQSAATGASTTPERECWQRCQSWGSSLASGAHRCSALIASNLLP